ncbi:translocation/assembly module TamB domain-containing protein [Pseudoalteromonas sp. McH1-7]|uniref:translocation/assembly module TamB domain-containing protein n=1 Tax=Pseudoalteromonas sp. McH1-7 TaxID=2745574 RepID=UPI00159214B0|nr:translocation/assembly module TamB domain-containing protein [Pseudoalteromonas sp. McH1-7]NUZ11341.1 translocation/assembly module TamB domain-containing protein [Pseudoalteromonas sp. McH1-7]
MQFRRFKIKLITASISVFILLVCLCFTLPGQQLLVWVANQSVAGLEIKGIDKRLLSGANLNLRYQNENIDVRLKDAKIALAWWSCASVCLSVDAKTIVVEQKSISKSDTQPSQSSMLDLPFSFAIQQAQIQQLSLKTPELNVQVHNFDTQLSGAGSHIDVSALSIDSVLINTKVAKPPASAQASAPLREIAPLPLPKVALPFTAMLGELTLNRLSIDEQTITNIKVSGVELAETVKVQHAQLNYQQWFLSTAADIALDNWTVTLDATMSAPQGLITASLVGQPHNLTLSLNTKGAVFSSMQAHANLTQKNWPFTLQGKVEKCLTPAKPVALKSATLSLQGDITNYKMSTSLAVNAQSIGDISATLDGHGGIDAFVLAKGALLLNKAQAEVSGEINWQTGLKASAKGDFTQLPIDKLLSLLPSNVEMVEDDVLNGQFALGFSSHAEQWQVNIERFTAEGQLAGLPIQAEVKFTVDQSLLGELSHAHLTYGKNKLILSGELGQQLDLHLDLQLEQTANALFPADIVGGGEVFIRGDHTKLSIQTELYFDLLRYQDKTLHGLAANGKVDIANVLSGQMKLALDRLHIDTEVFEGIHLTVKGDQKQHNIALDVRDKRVVASLKVSGKTQQSAWYGELSSGEITASGQTITLQNPAVIVLSGSAQRVASQCWKMAGSTLCFAAEQQSGQGKAEFKLDKLALATLQAWLPNELTLNGQTHATAKLAWKGGQIIRANGELNIVDVELATHGQRVSISEFKAQLKTDNKQLNADWRMMSETLGKFSGTTRLPLNKQTPTLAGKIKVESIVLAKLSTLLNRVTDQSFDLQGTVSGDIDIAGTLLAPEVNGKLSAQHLSMSSDSLPIEIDEGSINLDFNTTSAQLKAELNATKGGKLVLTGDADWSSELSAKVSMQGDELYLQPSSRIELTANPDLTLSYKDKVARVFGEILVPFGRVNIESLPAGVTSPSDDEIIVDAKVKKQMSVPVQHEIDLELIVGDNFRVNALGLDSFVTGAIEVDKQITTPMLATGELQLREGKYRAFGQDLLIRTGQIGFNGALDKPYLNIRAIRNPVTTANDVTAGVELTGSITSPRLVVFSEPTMDQAKALSYLLNGQPLGKSETSNNALLTQFLLSQGIDRSESFFSKAGESLGFSDVNLSAKGSGDDTQVEVSGYLTPNIQISYRVGVFESINEIALRYRVFSKFYVEATSGLYNSIDFLYKFDWDQQ